MKNLILVIFILSSLFLGCIEEKPAATPTPTATPAATYITPTVTPIPTIITPVRVQAVYKIFVDDILGFYRVVALNTTQPSPYDTRNRTLTINAGDKVIWVSESEDYTITIVSGQGLWDNSSAKLRWNYQEFRYTFTQPGTYRVYVKEFPKITQQKIVVNP